MKTAKAVFITVVLLLGLVANSAFARVKSYTIQTGETKTWRITSGEKINVYYYPPQLENVEELEFTFVADRLCRNQCGKQAPLVFLRIYYSEDSRNWKLCKIIYGLPQVGPFNDYELHPSREKAYWFEIVCLADSLTKDAITSLTILITRPYPQDPPRKPLPNQSAVDRDLEQVRALIERQILEQERAEIEKARPAYLKAQERKLFFTLLRNVANASSDSLSGTPKLWAVITAGTGGKPEPVGAFSLVKQLIGLQELAFEVNYLANSDLSLFGQGKKELLQAARACAREFAAYMRKLPLLQYESQARAGILPPARVWIEAGKQVDKLGQAFKLLAAGTEAAMTRAEVSRMKADRAKIRMGIPPVPPPSDE